MAATIESALQRVRASYDPFRPPLSSTMPQDDEEWTTEHHLVGTTLSRSILWPTGVLAPQPTTISAFCRPEHRQPGLWRSVVAGRALDAVATDFATPPVWETPSSSDRYQAVLLTEIRQRWLPSLVAAAVWEQVWLQFMQQPAAPTLRYYQQHPNQYGQAAVVAIAPNQLLPRIKQGCAMAWAQYQQIHGVVPEIERRSSSRLARQQSPEPEDPTLAWKITAGGRVASWILEHAESMNPAEEIDEVGDESDLSIGNPYLRPQPADIIEWLGRKTSRLLSMTELQQAMTQLLDPKRKTIPIDDFTLSPVDCEIWKRLTEDGSVSSDTAFVLSPLSDEPKMHQWDPSVFGKTQFRVLRADSASRTSLLSDKDQKAWEIQRYKAIHGGCTLWPSWLATVKEWYAKEIATAAAAPQDDLQLAQQLAQQQEEEEQAPTRGRRRREGGVFYGAQSSMTQKQLMDSLLRIISQSSVQTAVGLMSSVPDDSSDPLKRIRTSLGKLVWKRRQLTRLEVDPSWTDGPLLEALSKGPLLQASDDESKELKRLTEYIRELHTTELRLRRIVLENMSEIPVTIVATAADERHGSMEAMDDADFEDQSAIEWKKEGHEMLGKYIFRPASLDIRDDMPTCSWFRVVDYSSSLAMAVESDVNGAVGDRAQIGLAKEPATVERRMRFRVAPSDPPGTIDSITSTGPYLLLTEAQVHAGWKAGKMESGNAHLMSSRQHPFSGNSGSRVTLYSDVGGVSINATVMGFDAIEGERGELTETVLFMPEPGSSRKTAFWAHLLPDVDGSLSCSIPGEHSEFSIQQFDYDSTSQAYRECQSIVTYLQKHPKAPVFMQPVDPVALGIPTYFTVVKNPMDISTLEKKLEKGIYSNIPPSSTNGSSPVARMLSGPFRKDVELIFDNAMLFNPSDDWIHQAAASIKKSVIKKIEQIATSADEKASGRAKRSRSVYIDYDSDVDAYVYESDNDDDFVEGRNARVRKRSARQPLKEDPSARAIEHSLRLQKFLSDPHELKGPFANVPVNTNASSFSLSRDWSCRWKTSTDNTPSNQSSSDVEGEIETLIALYQQTEAQESSYLRRTTRAADSGSNGRGPSTTSSKMPLNVEFFCSDKEDAVVQLALATPASREDVEQVRERLHEEYFAKLYSEYFGRLMSQGDADWGMYSDTGFPPYLGSVLTETTTSRDRVSSTWQIRSSFLVPALRWIIRGLIQSEHLGDLEPVTLESLQSGVVVSNHAYFVDSLMEPFEVLDLRELQRRKRANMDDAEESEDDIELSEYEKLRQERVARNAERLKALGLA